uniref:Uncharacterized protein n=1 Tax=Anguilla anguilla TaxID=7936 RepID=A0A0E9PND4_ANGAN
MCVYDRIHKQLYWLLIISACCCCFLFPYLVEIISLILRISGNASG